MRQMHKALAASVIAASGFSIAEAAPPTGNVNVVNTPSVNIVNPNPLPVTVTNADPASTPYSNDVVGTCNGTNCFIDFPAVPQGKMLVIEHVSAIARSSSTTVFDHAELITSDTEDNTGARNYFALPRIGKAGSSVVADSYGFSQSVLAFVSAGQEPRLTLMTSVGGSMLFSQGTISGYLIPAP